MARLAPGDPAPTSPCPTPTATSLAGRPARAAQGGRLLLPGRDDAGLHDAGVRLPRQPGLAGRRPGYAVLGISPDKPEKLAKFRDRDARDLPAAVRPDAGDAGGVRRVRREDDVRQEGHRRHPLDVRGRRGRADRARAVQRQGHRPRRQAAPRPRRWTPPEPPLDGRRAAQRPERLRAARAELADDARLGVVDDRRRRARPGRRDVGFERAQARSLSTARQRSADATAAMQQAPAAGPSVAARGDGRGAWRARALSRRRRRARSRPEPRVGAAAGLAPHRPDRAGPGVTIGVRLAVRQLGPPGLATLLRCWRSRGRGDRHGDCADVLPTCPARRSS